MSDTHNISLSLSVGGETPQINMSVEPHIETVIENDHAELVNLAYSESNHTGFAASEHLPFVNENGVLMIWSNLTQRHINSGIAILGEIEIPQALLNTIALMAQDIAGLDFLTDVQYDAATGNQTFTRRDGRTKTVNFPKDNFLEDIKFDYETQTITFIMSQGATFDIDIADLIDIYKALENGGLGLDGNEFYILPKGVALEMLSDEVRAHFASQDDIADFGGGDMLRGVYDPQGKSQDVFAYTDEVRSLTGTAQTTANEARNVADAAAVKAATAGERAELGIANAAVAQLGVEALKTDIEAVKLTEDDKIMLAGIDNLQYFKGFASTLTRSGQVITYEVKLGTVTRAKRVQTRTSTTMTTVETFYNAAGIQISTATQIFDRNTGGSTIT